MTKRSIIATLTVKCESKLMGLCRIRGHSDLIMPPPTELGSRRISEKRMHKLPTVSNGNWMQFLPIWRPLTVI